MKIVHGDLLKMTDDFDVIIHGCNCFRTMGAGIAMQIRNKYPEAFRADCKTSFGDINKLGTYSGVRIKRDRIIIINAYTQFGYGNSGRHVSYDAVADVFEKIAKKADGMRVGYPMIGAGLAGGNWDIISNIINIYLKGIDHTLVVYDE